MKGRKKKGTGGVNEAEDDIKEKPKTRTMPNDIEDEAEEKKSGGRAKKAAGGKLIGRAEGEKTVATAARMPRKAGGRAGSESSPFTGAHTGKAPPGRKLMSESLD
jgi:hypothetical protein